MNHLKKTNVINIRNSIIKINRFQAHKGLLASIAMLLLINILSTNVLLGLYTVNPEIFIEILCVNKDKPELNCNGKCSLAKILQQQEEDKTTQTVISLIQTSLFENDYFTHDFNTTYTTFEYPDNFEYQQHYFFILIKEIIYPPREIAHFM